MFTNLIDDLKKNKINLYIYYNDGDWLNKFLDNSLLYKDLKKYLNDRVHIIVTDCNNQIYYKK